MAKTAIKVTYPDGKEKTYKTIEEASKDLDLSVAAIKIRCNKSKGTTSGIIFNWCDSKVAASYRAKKSRAKGRDFEYRIVEKLKNIGYTEVCRSAGESKKLDNNKVDIADPSNTLEVAIQAKHSLNYPDYFKIKSQTTDKRPLVVMWKKAATQGKNSPGTVAILSEEFFYELLTVYHNRK